MLTVILRLPEIMSHVGARDPHWGIGI